MSVKRQGARPLLAIVGGVVLWLVLAPAALAAFCPTTTNAKAFASAAELRRLVKQGEPVRRALPREQGSQPDDRLDQGRGQRH